MAQADTATVLFTDIVGSTELRVRLGDELADQLRREHDHMLEETVDQLGGRLVKGLGDGILATFAAASDGVEAAVSIQQAVHRLRMGNADFPLLRTGLSAGDVTFEDGDCFGQPVVEASRLCAEADGGQILCAEPVRWLARGRAGLEFTDIGALHLKGLPDPVPTCEVVWRPAAAAETPPLPNELASILDLPLAGRPDERDVLVGAFKTAAEGEARVALLSGEPGVGKTRLAAEVARVAHDGGATVLYGRCDDVVGVPYQPFVEGLRRFVADTADAGLAGTLGRYPEELPRLAPGIADRLEVVEPLRADPETERQRLFDAVASWLATVADRQPLVLVLDDLHWADKPSLLLLRHLVRSPEMRRVFIVGTYRDTDLDRRHPLSEMLADFRRSPSVDRIALSGLDSAGIAELLEGMAGHTLEADADELVRALYEETEGNPFFVREVMLHLVEAGAIRFDEGRWTGDLESIESVGMPEGVREVIGRRLGRLSGPANEALSRAAVIGPTFELRVLERVVGPDGDLLDELTEAEGAALITALPGSPIRYRFSHALIRTTLLEELTTARRVQLHRRIGEALEAVHGQHVEEWAAELAFHFGEASASGEVDKAVDYARLAGDQAAGQYAHEDAVFWYGRALEWCQLALDPPPAEIVTDLELALGYEQGYAGDPNYQQTLRSAGARAAAEGDAERQARAALGRHRLGYSSYGEVEHERVVELETALAAVGEGDTPQRAQLLSNLAAELTFADDVDRARRLSDEAVAVARRLEDARILMAVLGHRTVLLEALGAFEESSEVVDELAATAARSENAFDSLSVYFLRFRAACQRADRDEMDAVVTEYGQVAPTFNRAYDHWLLNNSRAALAILDGRHGEALTLAAEARHAAEEAGHPEARISELGFRWVVALRTGAIHEALMAETVPVVEDGTVFWRAAHSGVLAAVGDLAAAGALLDEAVADGFADLALHVPWLPAAVRYATPTRATRHRAAAAALVDRLGPYEHLVAVDPPGGSDVPAYALGQLHLTLGDVTEAERLFRLSLRLAERRRSPFEQARSKADLAEAMAERRGADDEVATLRHEARRTAEDLGFEPLLQHLEAASGP